MLATAVLLVPVALPGRRISRLESFILPPPLSGVCFLALCRVCLRIFKEAKGYYERNEKKAPLQTC